MSAIDEDYLKLRKQIEVQMQSGKPNGQPLSREYQDFKRQYLPKNFSFYEKVCRFAESLNIRPPLADEKRYADAIETCHLNATPRGVYGVSLLAPIVLILLGLFLGLLVPLLLTGSPSLFFFVLFVIVAGIAYMPLRNLPFTLAENWRASASNQMVLSMFYITTYMRHTSNLENAIDFAAEHVGPPLSLDFKKIIWNVQTEKYSSVQESLDHYLMQWKDTNLEFVEAMNLVQGSLYESSQDRRLHSLEKSMDIMLEETYEKMLHYAQNLKSPMTMLHMLGIILPILGLVILPLAVSFLPEVKWYHLAVLYDFLLPIGVLLLGKSILAKRPSSYGNEDITTINPSLAQYKTHRMTLPGGKTLEVDPASVALIIFGVFMIFALIPVLLHLVSPYPLWEVPLPAALAPHTVLGYTTADDGSVVGPYGLGAALLSLCFTLAFGMSLSYYYSVRSKRLIKIRDDTKALEQEFAGAIFQLGNRLGDGIPSEIAFGKVAEIMSGTKSGSFFTIVAVNIQKMGMSVEQAIFDPKRGALQIYPSPIIESSMKVLIESSKKGPLEASQSLITMSNYIKEMHRVEERLKDLMEDVISGMKSQVNFLTPAIAGIVVGITSMITTILGQLHKQLTEFAASGSGVDAAGSFANLNFLGLGIPTYFFQMIVGVYVVEITWLLCYLVNGIENGQDKLNEEYEQAKGLKRGVLLYVFLSFVVMLLFNIIAGTVLSTGLTG